MMDTAFAHDVIKGLTAKQKQLLSKYFYDDKGSRIFQEIMQMPEYYLTRCEFEILSLQAKQITGALQFKTPFNIMELGPGDGLKTFKLLEYLVHNNFDFNYVPIDISKKAVDMLSEKLKKRLPNISIQPKIGDYFNVLKETNSETTPPTLLLFLGSNIGNYNEKQVLDLLTLFNNNMKIGDKLLIGFDLKKNPITISNAYYDKNNITKRFNINLLIRINTEFDADFKIDDFDFYSHYNPLTGEVKSCLVSLKKQTVTLKKLNTTIIFNQNELIWTELSKKYSVTEIEALAKKSNYTVNTHFLDCKHYFADSLWEKQTIKNNLKHESSRKH